MRQNIFSRMMAIALSTTLTISSVNVDVFAKEIEDLPLKTITYIEKLDEQIAHQTLIKGSSEEKIVFPDSLDVTVTYESEKETSVPVVVEPKADDIDSDEVGADKEDVEDTTPDDIDLEDPETDDVDDAGDDKGTSDDDATSQEEGSGSEYEEDDPESESSDENLQSLLGRMFPATRVYAASNEPDTLDEDLLDDKESTDNTQAETVTETITLKDIDWELDEDNSSFDSFTSEEAGAKFTYVPVISGAYDIEAELPTITVVVVEGDVAYEYTYLEKQGVKVEGNLPVGSELVVEPIDLSEAEDLIDDPEREVVFALDICVILDGKEIELDDSVKVTIEPPVDESVLEDQDFELVHVHDDDSSDVVETEVSSQGELVFETDSFSAFVGTVALTGDYTVEIANGKSFSQNVKVNFKDASLIKDGISYVKLKLMGNISSLKVKVSDDEMITQPFVIDETDALIINGTIHDGEGHSTVYLDKAFVNIPAFVKKGTGDNMSGGTGLYEIPADFYGLQIEPAEGYSVSQGLSGSDTYIKVTPVREINDASWTTSLITIENSIMPMVNPSFSIDWQDNRNYADCRPYSTGVSITGSEAAISEAIKLFYKDGDTYQEVTDDSPILLTHGSNHPQVNGGAFNWTITYEKLPRYQDGTEEYQWYVKLDDSFFDEKKGYYNLSGLNEDGYFKITGSDAQAGKLTLTFTNGITGSINWRVGSETAENAISFAPEGNTLGVDNAVMKLYRRIGEGTAEQLNDGYTVEWTLSDDKKTWNYEISGLPLYTSNGDAILYYTVINSDLTSFKFLYDNGQDSTDTDKCLSGHKIYATRLGNAEFSFTKKWYDDGDVARRQSAIADGITFYLWRYPSNKTIADGAPVTYNAKQYSYTPVAGAAEQNSTIISLADFGASSVNSFPKYDEMGHEYIYYATEVSASNLYKTVYRGSDNEVNADSVAYNGGSICNVRSAKVAPIVTKQWSVSAIPDYVGSTCEMTLQRKENGAWTDVQTISLSGFSSSKKKVSGVFDPKDVYDLNGDRYEYRVIESQITSGGYTATFSSEWEAGGAGRYSAQYELNEYTYKAVSTYESAQTGDVESAEAIVVNKPYGTKDLSITKNWSGDGWGIGTDDKTGDVVIRIERAVESDAPSIYATVTMKKPVQGSDAGDAIVTYEDSSTRETIAFAVGSDGKSWKTEYISVPAYTEGGKQYTYSISELSADVAHGINYSKIYDRNVTGKKIDLSVSNYTGAGSSVRRIDVTKIWKDEYDSSQRDNVKIEFGTYDNAGNFTVVNDKDGKPYELILTGEREYSYYKWVEANSFAAEGETTQDPVAAHLDIRASLYNSVTGEYDRRMVQCTFDANGHLTGGYVPAIISGDIYRPAYKVEIVRSDDGGSFKIINTRVASRAFTFTKKWEDSANQLGYRGDFLRVTLFRESGNTEEEVDHKDIPTYADDEKTILTSGDALTVTFDNNGHYYPAYDNDGNSYVYSIKEYICHVDPSDPENITKDEVVTGATKETTTTGYVVNTSLIGTDHALISGENDLGNGNVNSLLITEKYEFINKAAGDRSEVPFYVIWHDAAKSGERPDIYLKLFYKVADSDLIPYEGQYTERWEEVEHGNKYVQKAIFGGLPSADADGNVYTYYVTETLNNAAADYDTSHYISALRNSNGSGYNAQAVRTQAVTTSDGTDNQLIVNAGAERYSAAEGAQEYTREGSFTLISIRDTVKIEGRKLWVGIPEGLDVEKLPNAKIYLYRRSAYDTDAANTSITAPQSLDEAKARFSFAEEFPKYDELGYLYNYSVREIIYNDKDHEIPAEIMAPMYSDNTADISNQYFENSTSNKRSFVVSKQWDISKNEDLQRVNAIATFRLYRTELDSDANGYTSVTNDSPDNGTSSVAAGLFTGLDDPALELVDEKTLTEALNNAYITWSNYPIFAPSGRLYAYYAVELTTDMPGYKAVLNGNNPDTATQNGSGAASGNTQISGQDYIGVAFDNAGISLQNTTEANTRTETFRNTYDNAVFDKITFVKEWKAKDFDGQVITSMIPQIAETARHFSLYALADMQSGKGNSDRISFREEDYDIAVAVDSEDATKWNYTITFRNGLRAPIYSANGNLYTYYVKETDAGSTFISTNYKADNSISSAKADGVADGTLVMSPSIVNSLKGSFTVQKMWDDFSNDYGMREGEVTFDVYYRLGANGTWTRYNSSPYTLNSSMKWRKTITELPVTSNNSGNNGDRYQYRIQETQIKDGGTLIDITYPQSSDDPQTTDWVRNGTTTVESGKYFAPVSAGNYKVYNPADIELVNGVSTVNIVNQLDTSEAVVALEVTKKWQDEGDKYGLRPLAVTVEIQSKKGSEEWSSVARRTLTEADADQNDSNVWKKSFTNLPKYYGINREEYRYRAVEVISGSAVYATEGASPQSGSYSISHQNDQGSASDEATGKQYTKFITAITGTLLRMDSAIDVTSHWNSSDESGKSDVTVALLSPNYKGGRADGNLSEISFAGNRQVLSDNGSFEYNNLPKFNKNGEAIEYYVKEVSTGNYKTQYFEGLGNGTRSNPDELKHTSGDAQENFHVTVVDTPLTSITGTKVWDDENNGFGFRPDRVVLTLQRKEEGGAAPWTTVSFDDVKRTNTSPEGVSEDGNGNAQVVVTEAVSWSAKIDKLPLYALSNGVNPVKYQYRLAELTMPAAYTRGIATETGALADDTGYIYGTDENGQTSKVTNHLVVRSNPITVKKVWNTTSDSDKKPVVVNLFSRNFSHGTDDGSRTLIPVAKAGSNFVRTLDESCGWETVFAGLPLKNLDGEYIVYYISETAGDDFSTSYYVYNGSGFDKVPEEQVKSTLETALLTQIVNTPYTSAVAEVIWSDNSNKLGIRPNEAFVKLQRKTEGSDDFSDVSEYGTIELNDGNGWKTTVNNLPLYKEFDGQAPVRFEYRFLETDPAGNALVPTGYTQEYENTFGDAGYKTVIVNTAVEKYDGILIIGNKVTDDISAQPINETLPYTVTLIKPDGSRIPFTGKYYLYDPELTDEELKLDAALHDENIERDELTSSDGTVWIPSGKVAVLVDINTMFDYEVTLKPGEGYKTTEVEGAVRNNGTELIASGQISSSATRVTFTNVPTRALKIENITKEAVDRNGNVLTGGMVKIYSSNTIVTLPGQINDNLEYEAEETTFVERAVSVEFKPDTDNGYSYSDTLTIKWWLDGEDTSEDPQHSFDISGYVYTDEAGVQHPYTGTLNKDANGVIRADSNFEEFEAIWSPLLTHSGSPFKNLAVLEGSVVVTLAGDSNDMPLKTIVQVEFIPPVSGQGGSSHNDGNSSEAGSENGNIDGTLITAISSEEDRQQDKIIAEKNVSGVKTGDDTPLTALIVLFMIFALCFAAVTGKYMRLKQRKK